MDHIPLSDGVIASLIGATATLSAAAFQMITNMRKQSAENRVKRKTPWLLVLALMLASGVGGFSYSEYRNWSREDKTDQLRAEVTKLTQLAMASNPPKTDAANPFSSPVPMPAGFGGAGEQIRDATITLPACKSTQVGVAAERPKCTEADAMRASVCVALPANVQVKGVEVFARAEDSQLWWADARVTPQSPMSNARLDDKTAERSEADGSRLVCQGIAHWDSDKGRSVRLLVRYESL